VEHLGQLYKTILLDKIILLFLIRLIFLGFVSNWLKAVITTASIYNREKKKNTIDF